ncbi:MAG: guanylate kinase [Gammaproteobacteria bacterium]|nr:guanylate kinase [Gammaproteobacteria bacterium]RZV55577.1 MAG: guanylate kinase [Pseudomonadales bacterium]
MERGSLFIFSAPAGTGKTSLAKALVEKLDNLELSVGHTTRNKDDDEQEGVDHYFVSVEEFNKMLGEASFLESAQIMGSYYGTSQQAIEDKLSAGIDVIIEIDWQGAQQVRHLIPESKLIFIMPPSIETLKQRLKERGLDSDDLIDKKLEEAKKEIAHFIEYEYLVFNGSFEEALDDLRCIIVAERQKIARQVVDHQTMIRYMM